MSGQHNLAEYIQQLRSELYATEAQIEHLRRVLRRAEVERESILGRINAHTALHPPIHDLPPEILALIFQCSFTAPFQLFESQKGAGPLLFGQVCRRWRQVAWTTPTLWSSLSIIPPPIFTYCNEARQMVAEALQRSGETSLVINSPVNGFSDIIAGHGHRLKALRMSYAKHDAFQAFQSLERLEKLELVYRTPRKSMPPFHIPMPQLHHFGIEVRPSDLRNLLVDIRKKHFVLPWAQLTSLYIRVEDVPDMPPPRSNLLRLISQCPRLVSLRVRTALYVDNDTTLSEVVVPDLRELHTVAQFSLVLPVLRCPALHTLTFEVHSGIHSEPQPMEDFIRYSGCEIEELRLVFYASSHISQLATVLQAISTVRHLELDYTQSLTFPFLESFERFLDSDTMFPRLCSVLLKATPVYLQLEAAAARNAADDCGTRFESALLQAIKRRRPQLQSLHLELHPRSDENDKYRCVNRRLASTFYDTSLYKGLRALEDDGMKVDVTACGGLIL
ncbi:hypothetical protein BDZ89DRAFT_1114043 [Hymenopellis radicata]|nr:hypothetical protein BDZ89DRAFT_1114043 [Hymenopellis radicata]